MSTFATLIDDKGEASKKYEHKTDMIYCRKRYDVFRRQTFHILRDRKFDELDILMFWLESLCSTAHEIRPSLYTSLQRDT